MSLCDVGGVECETVYEKIISFPDEDVTCDYCGDKIPAGDKLRLTIVQCDDGNEPHASEVCEFCVDFFGDKPLPPGVADDSMMNALDNLYDNENKCWTEAAKEKAKSFDALSPGLQMWFAKHFPQTHHTVCCVLEKDDCTCKHYECPVFAPTEECPDGKDIPWCWLNNVEPEDTDICRFGGLGCDGFEGRRYED